MISCGGRALDGLGGEKLTKLSQTTNAIAKNLGVRLRGISPVGERVWTSAFVLEYHGTREILWESGETTPQG